MQDLNMISAVEMAKEAGIDPKRFRKALRDEALPWHVPNERWLVRRSSPEHDDMVRVLKQLMRRGAGMC